MTELSRPEAAAMDVPGAEPARAERSGLRSRALRGSGWTGAEYLFATVLRFGSNLLLAHVLVPEAFALTALASIVLQALQMFSDIGVGPAIVQSRRGDDPAFLNTAWTIQVVRGFILWLATCILAWPAAHFYATPELRWVIPACGLSFITTGLQSTALQTRARDIDLGTITFLGLGESLIRTLVTVVWALLWPSVWAMIGGATVAYTLFMISSHFLLHGVRNRFAWDADAAKYILGFGRWVFASTMVTFLAMQTDRLILGKVVPMSVLGVYSIAYTLSRLPLDIGQRLAGQVQFPAIAEVFRRDPGQLNQKLRESRRLILALSQFGILGIIICSPWFFNILYDARYSDAALFCPLLAGALWFAILQASADRALLAVGDARSLAISNGTNFVVTVIGCLAGHRLAGVPGFIVGCGLGNLAGHAMVVVRLTRHGLAILRQDLIFTGLVVAVACISSVLPRVLLPTASQQAGTIVLGALGLMLSGWCMMSNAMPFIEGPAKRILARISGRVVAAGVVGGSRKE
ncbi:MAG: oligosaccharide flippase family protein [Planctomycetes bacterium]|nr:oligosaccharide flippase family protein [Planctomycetota bacterium]